jgi:hypothetical protein
MARSSRSLSRRNNNGGRQQSMGDVRRRSDWVTGGGTILSASPTTINAMSSWGGTSGNLPTTAACTWQAVTLPTAATAQNSPPGIGEVVVNEVMGSIFIPFATVAGVYCIGVGIYVSKYDSYRGSWDTRALANSTGPDASRDDFLMLRVITAIFPGVATVIPSGIEIPLAIGAPIVLGGGEALHVTVDVLTSAVAGNVAALAFFRSRISNIA